MLHIVQSLSGLNDALRYAQQQDRFILTQDAVYVCLQMNTYQTVLEPHLSQVFFLKPDMQARGIVPATEQHLQLVDFQGFVCLTEQETQSITWE